MALHLRPQENGHTETITDGSRSTIASNREDYALPSARLSALFETLTVQADDRLAPLSLVQRYYTEAIPRLQAVLPDAEIPHRSDLVTAAQCSSTHLRLLIYAVTNNLAGLEDWEGRAAASIFILEYMARLSTDLLRAYKDSCMRQALFRDFPSMRPLTETLFKAAVTVGNVAVAAQILSWPESGVRINEVVVVEDRTAARFTALEYAAHRQNLPLVKLLVQNGADVNGCQERWSRYSTNYYIRGRPYQLASRSIIAEARIQGSLECALCPQPFDAAWWEAPDYDDDLVSYLVQQGARIQPIKDQRPCEYLMCQISRPGHEKTVHLLCSRLINAANQARWMESGFFHFAFMSLGQDVLIELLHSMRGLKCDNDHELDLQMRETIGESRFHYATNDETGWRMRPLHSSRPFRDIARLRRLVDICAARGYLGVVSRLLRTGRLCSACNSNTLAIAISANQISVAQYMLYHFRVNMHEYSKLLDSTPFAEAVYLQNEVLLRFLPLSVTRISGIESCRAAIRAAAAIGDLERTRLLIQAGWLACEDTHTYSSMMGLALAEACHHSRTDVVKALLGAGASLTQRLWIKCGDGDTPMSPLGLATAAEDLTSMMELLDHGASDLSRSGPGDTGFLSATACAASTGNLYLLKCLTASGCDPAAALDEAIEHGHIEIVKEVFSMGVKAGPNTLRRAIRAQNLDMIELTLAQGARVVGVGDIKTAVSAGNEAITRVLCDRIMLDSSRYSNDKRSAILESLIEGRHQGILKSLLRMWGAHTVPSQQYSEKITWLASPLAAAVKLNGGAAHDILRLVLEAGADANALISLPSREHTNQRWDNDQLVEPFTRIMTSPLLEAAYRRRVDLIDLLVDFGADVNLPASRGRRRTPLQQAAETGSYATVKKLILHGADVHAAPATRGGATALQFAAIKGYIGIAELLINHGADICASGSLVDGKTAIVVAAECGRFDMVNYLASQVTIPDAQLLEAKMKAQGSGHVAIADTVSSMLLERAVRPALPSLLSFHRAGLAGSAVRSMPAARPTHSQDLNLQLGEKRSPANARGLVNKPLSPLWEVLLGTVEAPADCHNAGHNAHHDHDEAVEHQAISSARVAEISDYVVDASSSDETRQQPQFSSQFVCRHCQAKLSNASSLSRHIRTRHASPTCHHAYRCNRCSRGFPRKDLRDRHQATHDKNFQVYDPCPECHRRHRKDYLKKHIPLCRARAASRLAEQGAMSTMLSTFESLHDSSAEY